MAADPPGATVRLDKWLWHARFCKSRAIAQRLIEAGGVRVNAVRINKPSAGVRVGDGVSFAYAGHIHAVRIVALADRRGPASEARALYVDLDSAAASPPRPRTLEPGPEPDK